jgi:hypothetical protein
MWQHHVLFPVQGGMWTDYGLSLEVLVILASLQGSMWTDYGLSLEVLVILASLHWKQDTLKYMVSNLHNLILVFHILTIIVLTADFKKH